MKISGRYTPAATRVLALLLAVLMLFCTLPMNVALASDESDDIETYDVPVDSPTDADEELPAEEASPLIGISAADLEMSPLSEDDAASAQAWYEDAGAGVGDSEDNPYLIGTAEELAYLALLVDNAAGKDSAISFEDKFIRLTADIDLSGYTDDGGWMPIGIQSDYIVSRFPFEGTFDGDGHTISNLTIDRPTTNIYNRFQGLFGYMTNGAIKNLALVDVDIIGGGTYTGGIAGYMSGASITGSYVTGSIQGADIVGGIVGAAGSYGTIANCYTDVALTGRTAGGIAGCTAAQGTNVTISSCYSTGTISASSTSPLAAGIVADFVSYNSTIENCIAIYQSLPYSNFINAGRIQAYWGSPVTYIDNYAWEGTLLTPNAYPDDARTVTGSSDDKNGADISAYDLTGIVAWSAFSEEYWDVQSGSPPTLKAFTENSEIAQTIAYPEYIWDEVAAIEYTEEQLWYHDETRTDGTTYYIGTADELAYLAQLVRTRDNFDGKTVTLTADIDLEDADLSIYTSYYVEGEGWMPIGTSMCPFRGTFDGGGHVVKNLKINREGVNYAGLFGYAGFATIKNLGVIGAEIVTTPVASGSSHVGIVAGSARNIENCFSTGTVTGGGSTGGLTGATSMSLVNSYSTADVVYIGDGDLTSRSVGGVTGNSAAKVENAYSTGTVTGDGSEDIGGRGSIGGVVGSTSGYEGGVAKSLVALNPALYYGNKGFRARVVNTDTRYAKTILNIFAWEGTLVNGGTIAEGTAGAVRNLADNEVPPSGNSNVHGESVGGYEIYGGVIWNEEYAAFPEDVWYVEAGCLPVLRVFWERVDSGELDESVLDREFPQYILETLDEIGEVSVSGLSKAEDSNTFTASVANSLTSQVIEVTTDRYATFKLYSDAACTAEITDNTMILNIGTNIAYIELTSLNGETTEVYTVTITRAQLDSYTVTFNTNGGPAVDSQTVTEGNTAAKPDDPTRDGYTFTGWYTDSGLANSYNFDMPVTSNLTLYAGWKENVVNSYTVTFNTYPKRATVTVWSGNNEVPAQADGSYLLPDGEYGYRVSMTNYDTQEYSFTVGGADYEISITLTANVNLSKFTDVNTALWYKNAVEYSVANNLFTGTSATTWEPDTALSRAMFVTVLGKYEGIAGDSTTTCGFNDVPDNEWYTAYVQWASDKGYVVGTGDGNFSPNESITRQEMAVIFYKYAESKGADMTVSDTAFKGFSDRTDTSDWAKAAMIWATDKKVINGDDQKRLLPLGTATRTQAAQVFMSVIENIL